MSIIPRRLSLAAALQSPESEITDSGVSAYVDRIKKNKGLPGRVKLNLNTDPGDIEGVEEILNLLADNECELCQITFKHDFRYPSVAPNTSSLDGALQKALKRCPVRKIWGRLSGDALAAVPDTVVDMYLGIGGEKHYSQLASELVNITERLRLLDDLQIHLADKVDISLLKPLPGVDFLYVFLSNVTDEDVQWAVKAAAAMQPTTGTGRFTALRFPLCNFTTQGFQSLLQGLKKEGVETEGLWVSSKNIPRLLHETFTNLTLDILEKDLILLAESDMWRF